MGNNEKDKDYLAVDKFYVAMKEHAEQAQLIYQTAIEYKLTNTQEFINWQDAINACSFIQEKDLDKI